MCARIGAAVTDACGRGRESEASKVGQTRTQSGSHGQAQSVRHSQRQAQTPPGSAGQAGQSGAAGRAPSGGAGEHVDLGVAQRGAGVGDLRRARRARPAMTPGWRGNARGTGRDDFRATGPTGNPRVPLGGLAAALDEPLGACK
jgi:hypothetical protein